MFRIRHALKGALLAGAVALAAIGEASAIEAPAPPAAPQAPEALVREGAPPTVFLLYTGDVIGYLEPCG